MRSNGKSLFRIASYLAGVVLQATAAGMLGADTDLPKVPTGHPRVYVRPDDLAAIQAKLRSPEFSAAWAVVKGSSHPLCRGFVYLTTGEKKQGHLAVTGALRELEKCTDARTPADAMHWGACVYD